MKIKTRQLNSQLDNAKGSKDKAQDIKEVAQDVAVAWVGFSWAVKTWCNAAMPHPSLEWMVNPLPDGEKYTTKGNKQQYLVADDLDVNGEGQNQKERAKCEHSFVPIVNDELRKRVCVHFGLLLVMLSNVWECLTHYLEQSFFAKIFKPCQRSYCHWVVASDGDVVGFMLPVGVRFGSSCRCDNAFFHHIAGHMAEDLNKDEN